MNKSKEGLLILGYATLVAVLIFGYYLVRSIYLSSLMSNRWAILLFCFMLAGSIKLINTGREVVKMEKIMDNYENANYGFSKLYFSVSDAAIQNEIVKTINSNIPVLGIDTVGDFIYIPPELSGNRVTTRIVLDVKAVKEHVKIESYEDIVIEYEFDEPQSEYVLGFNDQSYQFYISHI